MFGWVGGSYRLLYLVGLGNCKIVLIEKLLRKSKTRETIKSKKAKRLRKLFSEKNPRWFDNVVLEFSMFSIYYILPITSVYLTLQKVWHIFVSICIP